MIKTMIISFIQDVKKRIFKKKNSTKSVYADLAPIESLSGEKESLKALHWALTNPRIKNIALTGPYGSGKSSVIESYLEQHKKCKAINISLATFDENLWDKIQELREEKRYGEAQAALVELEDILEKGILKQLFYKVNASKIPLSRYRKLHHIRLWKYVVSLLLFLIVGISIIYLVIPVKVSDFIDFYISRFTSSIDIVLYAFSFFVTLCGMGYLIRFVTSKFTIKEISVGDISAQSEERNKDSILNKNIDEMLYFFERTKYNVVFIEDLDRFNRTSIFIKLREINTLLNKYEVLKKKIVFVYAVRDDLFKEETERTKFFDFLIPVIPVINSTNSGEVMRNLLGLGEKKEENREYPTHDISQKFITLISPYIGDMRVLISTLNEFWIYKRTLKEEPKVDLDDECMLALMIYKNLNPKDFALLEAETGNIKDAFSNKKEAMKSAQENLEEEKKLLMCAQKDTLKYIKEIKLAILSQMANNSGMANRVIVEGKAYNYEQLLSDEMNFDLFKGKQLICYIVNFIQNRANDVTLSNIDKSSEELKNLFKRYDAKIKYKNIEDKIALNKFEEIENKITRIKASTLQQLIKENSVNDVLPENIINNDLLVFLLRHGYINESYSDYINYFHSGSISKDELNFILSIRNYKTLNDFSYPIKHCANVADRLYDYEFEQSEALNFELVDFLLKSNENELKSKSLVNQLVNNSETSRIFIKNYIDRGKNIDYFLPLLCHKSQNIWITFLFDDQLSKAKKDDYLKLILLYCDLEDIENNNVSFEDEDHDIEWGPTIKQYFEEDENILKKMSSIPWTKLKKVIDRLEISFFEQNLDDLEEQVINDIIDENLYELTPYMLEEIFQMKAPEMIEGLFESNYGHIKQLGIPALTNYVHQNFLEYVNEIIIGIDTNTKESIEDVEDIIDRLFEKNADICVSVIEKEYLARWEKITECLSEIENKDKQIIWDYLLNNNRTAATWENYLLYRNLFGLNTLLLQFINRNMDKIINSEGVEELTDTVIKELMIEEISINNFEKLIESYKLEEFTTKLSEFSEEKLKIMIQKHYFNFSSERLIELKEISLEISTEYIKENLTEFLAHVEECELDLNDIKAIIKLNMLNNREVLLLFEYFIPEDIDEEFALLIKEYDFLIPKEYVEASWEVLMKEDKYQLLYRQMEAFDLDEIADKFAELDGNYKQFSERTRHKFVLYSTDFNKDLCNKLLKIDFISSWDKIQEKESSDPITFKDKYEERIVGYVKKKLDKK